MKPDTAPSPFPDAAGDEDAEARRIEAQFAGMDNDLVDVDAGNGAPEARDEALDGDDVDETSAEGLQYPPGVPTSKAEADR